MNTDNVETDLKVEELKKERRRSALTNTIKAVTILIVTLLAGFVFYSQNEQLESRVQRVTVLESELDSQREQFLECRNADPDAEGCTSPVAPPAAEVEEGDPGERGPRGPMGPIGPRGPQGPQGFFGLTGPAGLDGVDGVDGTPGADGRDGSTGATGAPGPQGPQGPAGVDGLPGRGVSDVQCSGTSGIFTMTDGSTITVPNMCAGSVIPPVVDGGGTDVPVG